MVLGICSGTPISMRFATCWKRSMTRMPSSYMMTSVAGSMVVEYKCVLVLGEMGSGASWFNGALQQKRLRIEDLNDLVLLTGVGETIRVFASV